MGSSTVFKVRVYDEAAGTSKLTNCINITDAIGDKTTLSEIRNYLVKDKKLDSSKARMAFCTNDGARVVDSTLFDIYKQLLNQASEKEDTDKSKTEEKSLTTYDIYLELPEEKAKPKAELSEHAKKVLDSTLDMDLVKNKPELITATLKELSSTYRHTNFKASGKGEVVTPATMSEDDWNIVLRNTHFLNGNRMVFASNADQTRSFQRFDKAPFTAFTLKPRSIAGLELGDQSIKIHQTFKIPHYVTSDDSYVNVFETASMLSNSLASSSFSKMDIEASAGGTVFGASLAVKAGFSESESSAVASSSSESTRSMNITYNFPRVILHLDHRTLELSEDCKKALANIEDSKSLIDFHRRFGHFYARNIELGGKLFASEKFESGEEAHASEKANAMKVSASASFSYGALSASASYAQENQGASESKESKSDMKKSLSWEAQGGDTTLCNDPPNWCPTVKPFKNWRVINQKDVMPIGDFIGQFVDYQHIPAQFNRVIDGSRKVVPCKFRLRAGKDAYYGLRTDKDGRRLHKVLMAAGKKLGKPVRDSGREDDARAFEDMMKRAEKRVSSGNFTNNFEEYIGIDSASDGCIFEVEVETTLEQTPRLRLNTPYRIYNKKFQSYLSADKEWSLPTGGPYAYMFYCRKPRSKKWMFRKSGNKSAQGEIGDGADVELALCDEDENPVAVVQKFKDDGSTLLVSKYGVEDGEDLTTKQPAKIEYYSG